MNPFEKKLLVRLSSFSSPPLWLSIFVSSAVWFNSASAQVADASGAPTNVTLPSGYAITRLATGLDFPTSVAFSGDRIWVAEAGIISPTAPPRVKEIGPDGSARVILSDSMFEPGRLAGPITDITYRDGFLWMAHRESGYNGWLVGVISRFDPNNPVATFTNFVTGLPSAGDHYVEEITFDTAGRLYFSQGSGSNSSVVGPDNELITGWLGMFPTFHDFSPVTVVLSGVAYTNHFPFALDPLGTAVTAPYSRFNSGALPGGTVVLETSLLNPQEGMIAGNGAVYSFDPAATNRYSTFRLEAWGLRNPYGIGFDPRNPTNLFVSNNGADTRSKAGPNGLAVVESRPIRGDWDDLFVVPVGGTREFYGWPDYFHDAQTKVPVPVTDPRFSSSAEGLPIPPLQFVLAPSFLETLSIQPAVAQFEEHSSANKFDFGTDAFRAPNMLFVAETGAFVPVTGAAHFVGYKIVRVDPDSGAVQTFIEHPSNTPSVIFERSGFNKPIDVKFRNQSMFVVDFGLYEPGLDLAEAGTGKLWVVLPSLRTEARTISGAAVPPQAPQPVTTAAPGEDPRRRTGVIPTTSTTTRRSPTGKSIRSR